MSIPRFVTRGTTHALRPDPGRTRHSGARFVRPEGEPTVCAGTMIVAGTLGVMIALMLVGASILNSAVPRHNAPPAAAEVNAAGKGDAR